MNDFHACPICFAEVAHFERYPKQVCDRCMSRASDAYGRRLTFSNVDVSGGFQARYRENGAVYTNELCWIDGIKCHAGEHRFGGIVVETVG